LKRISDRTISRLQGIALLPDLESDRYQIVAQIGQGGMSTVFVANDLQLEREVAVKVLDVRLHDPENRARMLREARVIASLEHPGIVPIHDLGELSDGSVYYVMKLVRGNRIDNKFILATTLQQRLQVFQTVCETIAFAHSRGILHRDVKPENIMIGAFGEVLVMDWGIARFIDQIPKSTASAISDSVHVTAHKHLNGASMAETAPDQIIGTPAYMAPEQVHGGNESIDARTDVFGLGGLLYFLLTGRPPFDEHSTHSSRSRHPRPPREIVPDIPKPLAAICLKALSVEKGARYAGAEELVTDIQRFLSQNTISAYREPISDRALRWINRNRFIVFLVLAYLLMRIALLFFSLP
jgi:serine/threonine protein kinase